MTLKKNGHIVVEEIPTNSASSGAVAGLPPDEPPVRKKKRKNKMGIDIFQRIRNSRIKEQTMENQTTIKEYSSDEKTGSGGGSNEVSATMRFIQQKRKMNKKQEREKRASNRKQEIQTISRAKASDYQKKAKDRQKKLSTQLATKKEEWDGIVYMESILEQLENENENPVSYFFNDDSELEVTNEEAYDIIEKFGSLSDDNKEMFLDKIAESKNFLNHIIRL